jgi:hypothetical protein
MKKKLSLDFLKQSPSLVKIKEELDALFEDKIVKLGIRLSLSLLFLTFILVIVFWFKLPPKIPLFYSRPWGKDQLAAKLWFLILIFLSFFMVVLNLRLASIFLKKEVLLAKILVWITVILTLLISTTVIRVLLIAV